MDIPSRMTRAEALAAELVVSTSVYPWRASTAAHALNADPVGEEVYTDLEATLIAALSAANPVQPTAISCHAIRKMVESLDAELAQGYESPTLQDSLRQTVLDATVAALAGSGYADVDGQVLVDSFTTVDVFASRRIGPGNRYVAELHIQVMADGIAFSGSVRHAEDLSKLYDDKAVVQVSGKYDELAYAAVVDTLRRELDAVVMRVGNAQGFAS